MANIIVFLCKLTKVAGSPLLRLDFSLPLGHWATVANGELNGQSEWQRDLLNMSVDAVCRYEYATHNLTLTYIHGVAVVERAFVCVYV